MSASLGTDLTPREAPRKRGRSPAASLLGAKLAPAGSLQSSLPVFLGIDLWTFVNMGEGIGGGNPGSSSSQPRFTLDSCTPSPRGTFMADPEFRGALCIKSGKISPSLTLCSLLPFSCWCPAYYSPICNSAFRKLGLLYLPLHSGKCLLKSLYRG